MPASVKILIVDDEQGVLITLGDILTALGHRIFTANNGPEAAEMAMREKIDVVLMDFRMPGMNGVETFREIKKSGSKARIIFITAYYEESLINEALSEGASGVCHKPLNIPRLLDYINAAAEDRAV